MNTHELGEPGGCTHCALNAKARRVPAAQRAVAAHGAGAVRRQRPHVVPGARWSTTPWDVGLGAGVGWIGAGSRSLGNGGSQFPPIDVAVRAGGARGLHKHPSGTARPVPRRAAGRCETMARLTGTRPTAARRWGCAATAFLLLLLTVQAGKGGGGGGRRGGVPGSPDPLCPGGDLGLSAALQQPLCHGGGWMWLLDVLYPTGRSGCPAQGSALWALRGEGLQSPPDPRSAGFKPALGWVICGIASRPEADWRDGAKFIKMSRGGSGGCAKHVGGRGAGGRLPVPTGTELPATLSLCTGGVGSWYQEEAGITLGAGTVWCHPSSCSAAATGTSACRESQNLPRVPSPHVGPPGGAGVWGSSQGTALPTWGQERAGSPGSVPACPAQGHFPARPSLVHGGLSPSAAERQLVGSQRHSCPHVPLSSPHTLGSSQPFGTVRSTGKMRTKQSFPSALLATHPALLCLVLGHSSGTVPPPHSPES